MDDIKATTLKEKKIKIKIKFTVYEDEHKQEINIDHCTNLIGMPIPGRVMPNPH